MSNPEKRPPTQDDVHALAQVLKDFKVDYILIGGVAMALHGYPRMTRDVDVLLPVDIGNNHRLLDALESLPFWKNGVDELRSRVHDEGVSTTLEGEIVVDLLYGAGDKTFEDYRKHIQTVLLEGIPVETLDVDGMLMSKDTARAADLKDRLTLGRIKSCSRLQG